MEKQKTFIIDCPSCKAKVAAYESGTAEHDGCEGEYGEPFGYKIFVGNCPRCSTILVGEARQIAFEQYDSYEDRWSDITRVYPKPSKTFISHRIPRVVRASLNEADRSLQAGANIAACAMLGRAIEALCRDILNSENSAQEYFPTSLIATKTSNRNIMLGEGIKVLREKEIIDNRLYEWSQHLKVFRNLAAHPEDINISRNDAEDLQTFVNAIVEYVYDLADLYDEFKARVVNRQKAKNSS